MTNPPHEARALLAAEYEAATDAPAGAGQRFHAANVRVMHKRDYTDWRDKAALRAIEAALAQVEAVKEACAIAARNALVAYEWPPQDGDAQVDAVLAAIRALDVATDLVAHPAYTKPVVSHETAVDVIQSDRWLPIETAPRDGRIVLLTSIDPSWKYPFPAKWGGKSGWVFADEPLNDLCGVSDLVSHWQPLPQPPSGDRG